jgi:hypothetical protein
MVLFSKNLMFLGMNGSFSGEFFVPKKYGLTGSFRMTADEPID